VCKFPESDTTRLAGVLLVVALVVALYWPTSLAYSLAWMGTFRRSDTHGYLIVLMCLVLLYLRRAELAGGCQLASPLAYLALAVLGLGWLVAYCAGIQVAHELLLPVIIWTALYAVFGWQVARACLFPVGFLYFAVPAWGLVNGPLQALTIMASKFILRLIGVPVYFEGNIVQIPDGSFAIEGGCSGLHFLLAAAALATYYGELHRDSLRNRLHLLALAAALALVTNWIRVCTVITAGHLTHMHSYLVRVSHYGFGWAIFGVAMTVFFALASRIPTAIATNEPPRRSASAREYSSWPAPRRLALALIALSLAPALLWRSDRTHAADLTAHAMPDRIAGWNGPLPVQTIWKPVFKGADRELLASYRRGTANVELYTAVYGLQRQGKELLGYDNSMLGTDELTVVDQDAVTFRARRFVQWRLRDSQGAESLLWYAYRIGARQLSSGLATQLWYGVLSLSGPVESQILALRVACVSGCDAAREQLQGFVDVFEDRHY
jgi:exosortase A